MLLGTLVAWAIRGEVQVSTAGRSLRMTGAPFPSARHGAASGPSVHSLDRAAPEVRSCNFRITIS
jgi:hypothetical protein